MGDGQLDHNILRLDVDSISHPWKSFWGECLVEYDKKYKATVNDKNMDSDIQD